MNGMMESIQKWIDESMHTEGEGASDRSSSSDKVSSSSEEGEAIDTMDTTPTGVVNNSLGGSPVWVTGMNTASQTPGNE